MPKKNVTPVAAAPSTERIELPTFDRRVIQIVLSGDSPLICHKWSEKAKKQMLDKQMKRARGAKESKDPEQDYRDSLYVHPDGGYGFPAVAFKASAVGACSQVQWITKVLARSTFHVIGELLPIHGEPSMREDMVRIAMGTSDIRYRGEFKSWWVEVDVEYNAAAISAEQIVHLFNIAGFGVGLGEWRPERDGQYGRFHVATEAEITTLRKAAK